MVSVPDVMDYTQSEMLTCVDFELPLAVKHLDKLKEDKVVVDQLLANVERNRVKWRNDLSSDSLSV